MATPDDDNVPVPSVVEPSENVTGPVGVAEPEAAATVAVNVIDAPAAAVVADAWSVVVDEPPPERAGGGDVQLVVFRKTARLG